MTRNGIIAGLRYVATHRDSMPDYFPEDAWYAAVSLKGNEKPRTQMHWRMFLLLVAEAISQDSAMLNKRRLCDCGSPLVGELSICVACFEWACERD